MKILITGAAGFLGRRLIETFLLREEVPSIVAVDLAAIDEPRVDVRAGSITDRQFVRSIVEDDVDVVYHLAAVLSGQSENEFDLGMAVNVDATRSLLDACRGLPKPPRFIFTSSLAVFGGEVPEIVPDDFVLRPRSSYGVEKRIGELLVSEYSRRGFVDGITCRLPTIAIRPGRPNSAASSFVSGIIREPLSGLDSVCPVRLSTRLWICSPDTAIENLVHAAFVKVEGDRSINAPGVTVTAADMLDALERIGGVEARARVRLEEDERIKGIVCSWPGAFDVRRAMDLGFVADADFDAILRQFMRIR